MRHRTLWAADRAAGTDSVAARPWLGVLATHPIQYQVPLYQLLSRRRVIDLEVAFCSTAGLTGYHDPGFGVEVTWDIDLTSGYRHRFLATGGSRLLRVPILVVRLVRWLRRQRAVVIHGHRSPIMLLAALLCRVWRRPYLLRGEAAIEGIGTGRLRRVLRDRIARTVVRGSAAALPIGSRNAAFYQHFGQPRLFPAPYSVDDIRFSAGSRRPRAALISDLGLDPALPVVLFCGKLLPVKRPLDVVEAFRMVQPSANLLVVGDGELREEVLRRLPERNAVVSGFVHQSRLPEFYAASDVLVLPSSREPWGLVVNEAMHAGVTPVVSDRVGCGPDLVAGVGEIFPCGDVPQLARALERALSRAEVDGQRRAVQARAALFSLQRTAEGYEAAALFLAGHPFPLGHCDV